MKYDNLQLRKASDIVMGTIKALIKMVYR